MTSIPIPAPQNSENIIEVDYYSLADKVTNFHSIFHTARNADIKLPFRMIWPHRLNWASISSFNLKPVACGRNREQNIKAGKNMAAGDIYVARGGQGCWGVMWHMSSKCNSEQVCSCELLLHLPHWFLRLAASFAWSLPLAMLGVCQFWVSLLISSSVTK